MSGELERLERRLENVNLSEYGSLMQDILGDVKAVCRQLRQLGHVREQYALALDASGDLKVKADTWEREARDARRELAATQDRIARGVEEAVSACAKLAEDPYELELSLGQATEPSEVGLAIADAIRKRWNLAGVKVPLW